MFREEINSIRNEIVKEIAEEGISLFPDYFFRVPASSSGNYHPSYALGEGGLYRHVRAAFAIAEHLFRIYSFTELQEDLIRASIILHDGWKQGENPEGGHTLHEHPVVATKVLSREIGYTGSPIRNLYLFFICKNIESHMGQWTTSNYSDVVLPLPQTEMEKFVHLCDYLASRKQIEYNFSIE